MLITVYIKYIIKKEFCEIIANVEILVEVSILQLKYLIGLGSFDKLDYMQFRRENNRYDDRCKVLS